MIKLEAMEKGGKINREVMQELLAAARPGVCLSELDKLSGRLIAEHGGVPSFKGYKGFSNNICSNINNGLIHGIPGDYKLKLGDVLTLDQGVFYEGFHTDHAGTMQVKSKKLKVKSYGSKFKVKEEERRELFLNIGKYALDGAIEKAIVGNRVGDISNAIQETIEKAGFFVVKEYVGHGVGSKIHEEPQIPCFGKSGTGPELKEEQTLAIEVMYTDRPSKLVVSKDGWTVVAESATLSALFEKTIMVRRAVPLVLT